MRLLIAFLLAAVPAAAADRPNVLLILSDDQGWGDVRSHGNAKIDTPVLDRLAASGARFDRFFVSPVCAPTRASVLTGRYHLRTGVSWVTRNKETMRAEEVTLAERLKRAGYAAGCFGKWHNGRYYPHDPQGQGFDTFVGFRGGHWNDYFDMRLQRGRGVFQPEGYITDVLTDHAIDFIKENRKRPFLCYVPYNVPHSPFQVPEPLFEKYRKRGFDVKNACVYGMVENMDANIGRLLRALDELKLGDNTIVIFLSDNGANTPRFNGGMRGRKGSVHEGGGRVPCFVRYPKLIQPGTVIRPICAHIDLLPTLLEMCRVAVPKKFPLDGVSLTPLLTGKATEWPDRLLFTHQSRGGGVKDFPGAVRSQRWRLVNEGRGWRLFDMRADPGQKANVAARHPEVVGRLKSAYGEWFRSVTAKGFATPAVPVGHDAAPAVTITAPEAELTGGVRYHGRAGWANDWIDDWANADARIRWPLDVVAAGRYRVELLYCCPRKEIGSVVRAEVGGKALTVKVDKAHDPEPYPTQDRAPRKEVQEKPWGVLPAGVVELPAGRTNLDLRAVSVQGDSVMELKAVRMTKLSADK